MNSSKILELYDKYERMQALYPNYKREETGVTTRLISLAGGHNVVIHSSLTEDTADAAIQEELDYFKNLNLSFEWKLYSHDRPKDLKSRLAAKGFLIGEDEAIMALELSKLPAMLKVSSHHDIRRVTHDADFQDYVEVNRKTWPHDAQIHDWLEAIRITLRDDSDRMSAYVAYIDGRPVCSARIDFPKTSPFASLWGGATLEPYRKRGIYTAILAIRAQEAIARGYKFLTIDASPMSRSIVARHGFQLLSISNPATH